MFHQNFAGNKDDYDELCSFECAGLTCDDCSFVCSRNKNPVLACLKDKCDNCGGCQV